MELKETSILKKPKKEIICYILKEFYRIGWAYGTGGGVALSETDDEILITPSGLQKDLLVEDDILTIDRTGKIIKKAKSNENFKTSVCTKIFLQAFNLRNAKAVLHAHSLSSVMISKLFGTEFQCIDMQMIKGIKGFENDEWCRVPIIDLKRNDCDMADDVKNALIEYPRTFAFIIRNHGVYAWGDSWERAKLNIETYDYLFSTVLEMFKFNLPVPKTIGSDTLRAWMIDSDKKTDNLSVDLQHNQVKWIHINQLQELGIFYQKLSGREDDEELEKIKIGKNFKNSLILEVHPNISNYREIIESYQKEHFNEEDQVRYILEGSGYFDVRDKADQWIRIHVTTGDLIIFPEGIYHRYCQDISMFIKEMVIYKSNTLLSFEREKFVDHESRKKYISNI